MHGLTEEQLAVRDMTRDVVRREVTPFAASWDREETVPVDVVLRLGALGLFGVCAPAEWSGTGADFLAYVLATEELAYGDAGICNMVNAANSYGWKLRDYGTPEQKERFLRPVAGGSALGCMLLTEPDAGSDAANIRTRATRRGGSYVLNGTKCFITSGRSSAFAVIFAVTDPGAGKRGISAFVTRTDRPGYRVVRLERKLGHRTNDTCHIALEDLEVPAEDMLGNPGEGLRIALSALDSTRVGAAAQAIGVARAALDAALAYARQRQTFGKPIIEH
jgi:alkylation response protein AidB-like acyl-CoA dehydrogenase